MNPSCESSSTRDSRPKLPWIRRVGQKIGWSGWLTAGAVVLSFAGLALAIGLPVERVRWFVLAAVLGCGVMHFATRFRLLHRVAALGRRLFRGRDGNNAEESAEDKGKEPSWQQLVGTALGVFLIGAFLTNNDSNKTRIYDYTPPKSQVTDPQQQQTLNRLLQSASKTNEFAQRRMGQATSAYWEQVLVPFPVR